MQINHSTTQTGAPLQQLQAVRRSFMRGLKNAFARIQKGRTETVLMRLSDATLRDIGVVRGEIPHVASIVAGLVPDSTCGTNPNRHRHIDHARVNERRNASLAAKGTTAAGVHTIHNSAGNDRSGRCVTGGSRRVQRHEDAVTWR